MILYYANGYTLSVFSSEILKPIAVEGVSKGCKCLPIYVW